MQTAIIFLQGIFEIVGLGSFLYGYFMGISWFLVIGGCLVVLDDCIELALGVLKPTFPVLLAIVLALIMKPWYVGIFWASSAFKVLGIPAIIMKIVAPKELLN